MQLPDRDDRPAPDEDAADRREAEEEQGEDARRRRDVAERDGERAEDRRDCASAPACSRTARDRARRGTGRSSIALLVAEARIDPLRAGRVNAEQRRERCRPRRARRRASRHRLTGSVRNREARSAVTTTLVSRTAATDAAEARWSASRTMQYAPKVATPATIVAALSSARSLARGTVAAYASAGPSIESSRYGSAPACVTPCLSTSV